MNHIKYNVWKSNATDCYFYQFPEYDNSKNNWGRVFGVFIGSNRNYVLTGFNGDSSEIGGFSRCDIVPEDVQASFNSVISGAFFEMDFLKVVNEA